MADEFKFILRGDENGNTIYGSEDGRSRHNIIYGEGGNDVLFGLDGKDAIYGGEGADQLYGGVDDDVLYGEAGADLLDGGSENDILDGGLGADRLNGGLGDDTYRIIDSGDEVTDEGGNDVIQLTTSVADSVQLSRQGRYDLIVSFNDPLNQENYSIRIKDQFNSNYQIELLRLMNGSSINLLQKAYSVKGDQFNNILYGISTGGNPDDILFGEAGNDQLLGYLGNDTLDGGAGDDELHGHIGNDILKGGVGRNELYGGEGDDLYHIEGVNDWIQDVNGQDVIQLGEYSIEEHFLTRSGRYDLTINIFGEGPILTISNQFLQDYQIETLQFSGGERLALLNHRYTVEGDEQDNILHGISVGGNPDDVLIGRAGNDTLNGYLGNDMLMGNTGKDRLQGHEGDDLLDGGADDDVLIGGIGNDNLIGSDGNDDLQGNEGDDRLEGSLGDDQLFGHDGNDTLIGGAGNNNLNGGRGDDDYYINDGNAIINDEGGVEDTLHVSNVNSVDALSLVINTNASVDLLINGEKRATINNQLNSNHAIEYVALADNTTFSLRNLFVITQGTNRDDEINGLANVVYGDKLLGLEGHDVIHGHQGNDELQGGSGNDTLYGGEGNDVLIGGAGDDFLNGDSGNNVYVFGPDDGKDFIAEDTKQGTGSIKFINGITANDVRASTDSNGNFYLHYQNSNSVITIDPGTLTQDPVNRIGEYIQSVEFEDGTRWNLAGGLLLTGTENNETQYGSNGNDRISGGGGNDQIFAYEGNDVINGGNGDDVIDAGKGNNIVDGGEGVDTLSIFGLVSLIEVLSNGTYAFRIANQGSVNFSNIEKIFDPVLSITEAVDLSDFLAAYQSVVVEVSKPAPSLIPLPSFTVVDPSGTPKNLFVTVYDGVVSFLDYQLLGTGEGEVVIGADSNDFISVFGGNDAIDGGNGQDVLDGGTGSNFLTGGLGNDTFFLDGRNVSSTWSTIRDYTHGDTVNIWGWNPGTSSLILTQEMAGVEGYQGATLHYDLDNNGLIDTSLTFTGLSLADVPNTIFQTVEGNGYIAFLS